MIRRSNVLAPVVALVLAAVPANVLAHGKRGHVMGTVASVDATHLKVTTKEGKTVDVPLNGKTKFKKGTSSAFSADVKPGMRVIVHLAEDGSAGEVHLPAGSAAKKP